MRRFLLSLALAVSMAALYASPTVAQRQHRAGKRSNEGAQKAPLYGPFFRLHRCEGAPAATPMTFGFAILNTPGNETTVTGEVALKHAAPNATYEVSLTESPAGVACEEIEVGEIHTNVRGNGNLAFAAPRVPGTTMFNVVLFRAPPFIAPVRPEVFATPTVELD